MFRNFCDKLLSGISQKILSKKGEFGILPPSAGGKDAYETTSRHINTKGTQSLGGLCRPREKECARDYPSADFTVVRRRTERTRTDRALGSIAGDSVQRAQEISAEGAGPYSRAAPRRPAPRGP